MDNLGRLLTSRFHFILKKAQFEGKRTNAEGVKSTTLPNQQEAIQPGIEGSSISRK